MSLPQFTPAQFMTTKFATAEEKARFANAIVRFIDGGCQPAKFTQTLYNRCCHLWGFIAEFERGSFIVRWFSAPEDKTDFVDAILRWVPCGYSADTWSDVERAVTRWVAESHARRRFAEARDVAIEQRERAELARLKAKYEGGPR